MMYLIHAVNFHLKRHALQSFVEILLEYKGMPLELNQSIYGHALIAES
jgi:hypothetical protein